ncbi:short-chain dehydrogenase/reductase family 9C member 7-like [Uloborus diversus]|uniref:short-chain dehydrogenase/reductase family 9C member 7-like n=1 Tax=Uloborus diversus TaxID=327109 RepID=UPI00240901A4|nr:short-chain dehydrogenase/reductase family 9C member 7-like [Uloborus diversus]
MAEKRPKTLACAARLALQEYGVAAIAGLLILVFLPWWIRWCLVYLTALVFLASVLAPFVEDFRPRPRVQPDGKAVFVTGCDSGFGHHLARKLDDLGLHVFAGCLRPDGEGAKNLQESASSRLHILPLNVTSEDSIKEAVRYVEEHLKDKKLWCVVNNAGLNEGGELMWTNMDFIEKVVNVNTYGVVRTTKAFLPLLCKHGGRVVVVASAAGRYTYPGMVPYCMSKQATVSFCDGLRLEMYRFGIKVVTIEPWMYKTPITNANTILDYVTRAWDSGPAEIKELLPPDYLDRHKRATLKFINLSISDQPQQVVDCLEEAVMAVNPKYSYNPGTLYSRLTFWFLKRMPKPIADLIINDEVGTKI